MIELSYQLRHESVSVLLENMAKLTNAVTKKLNRKAVEEAVKPIESLMRDIAPVGPGADAGDLKKSIGRVVRTKKGAVIGVVGPMRGKARPAAIVKRGKNKGKVRVKIPTRYAHLQEFGSSHQPARPFARPAWDEYGGEAALNTYAETLMTGVEDEVNKIPGQIYR